MEIAVPVLLSALTLYFLPFIVAGARAHHATWSIFFLDLLLGWTLVGWAVALAWAAGPVYRVEPLADDATRTCPRCAETIKAAALACRFCGHEFRPELAIDNEADTAGA